MLQRFSRVLSAVLLFAAAAAHTQVLKWTSIGQSLNTQTGNQTYLAAAPTGAGKFAMAWADSRSTTVYAAYVDSTGAAPVAGFNVSAAQNEQPGIAGDGFDGCIIAWAQKTGSDIAGNALAHVFTQHFTANGAATWNSGQPVQVTINALDTKSNVMVFPGANHSAFVIYTTTNPNMGGPGADLYMQRIDQNGNVVWQPGGTPIATGTGDQQFVAAVPNNAGGMILIWSDGRGLPSSPVALYAQSIDSAGATIWGNNGIIVSGTTLPGGKPAAIADGAGGVIFAFAAQKSAGDSNIIAQRLNSGGTRLWGTNGLSICDTSGLQGTPAIASDGGAGAVIAWEDHRAGATDIFAQHVTAGGAVTWKSQGLPVCTSTGEQTDIHVASNDKGGAVLCWTDRRNAVAQIYMQSVTTNGVLLWAPNGIPAGSGSALQQRAMIVTAGLQGNALLVWEDSRNSGTGVDVYGQRVGIQPALATSRLSMDFGARTTHAPWVDSLRITSIGTDSLSVRAWSFTGPSLAKDSVFVVTAPQLPFKLAPGENVVATVRFTPYRNPPNIDTLIIHCTALGTDSVRRIALYGTGKYPHCRASMDTVDFGGVRLRTTKTIGIAMRNVGTDTAHISSHALIGSTKDQYSDAATNYRAIPPNGDSIPLAISCTPTGLGGQNASLQLTIDDSTSPYTIRLLANGIFPKATLTRPGLTFGKVRLATGKRLTVGVINVGTDTLHVDSVLLTDDPDHFTVQPAAGAFPLAVKPLDTLNVNVTFTPDTLRTFRGTMQIFTDDTSKFYQVNLVGQGSFASLELRQSLEFGPVLPPQSPDSQIVVRYAGSDTVMIKSYAITGADSARFTVSGIAFPFGVTAGETKLVHVRYTPTAVKRDNAVLTFYVQYTGGSLDTLPVALSGGSTVGVFDFGFMMPGITLDPSYPNPVVNASSASATATIAVRTEHAIADADVLIFNSAGMIVQSLFHGTLEPGSTVFKIFAVPLSAGSYACMLRTREGIASRRFTVVK